MKKMMFFNEYVMLVICMILKLLKKIRSNICLIFMTIIIILFYYIYIFVFTLFIFQWNLVPMLQSSNNGLDLEFWEYKHPLDYKFYSTIFYLIFFHYSFFWMTYTMIQAALIDPGEMSEDYKKAYSLIPFKITEGKPKYILC